MKNLFTNLQLLTIGFVILLSVESCSQTNNGKSTMENQEQTHMTAILPPLKPGQTLDPDSDYAKYWLEGYPLWVKLNDEVTLRVPRQFGDFWIYARQSGPKGSLTLPKDLEQSRGLMFSMLMPDFAGFTPDNYLTEFNEDEIKIIQIEPQPMSYAEPGAAGTYPPNMFKRAIDGYDINQYTERYGLKCYESKGNGELNSINTQFCYGLRDQSLDEYILINLIVPPYPTGVLFPTMSAKYFSKQYGGLEISWRAHAKHFSRWHDIDQQIWQYIEEWRVKNPNQTSQALPTATPTATP